MVTHPGRADSRDGGSRVVTHGIVLCRPERVSKEVANLGLDNRKHFKGS